MRCRRIRELLDVYLDRDECARSAARSKQVEAHLERCANCMAELMRLQRLREVLAEAAAPSVPEGFAGRVVAKLKAQPALATARPVTSNRYHRAPARWLRLASGTAAALAVGLALGAFLGNGVWRDGSRHRQALGVPAVSMRTEAGLGLFVGGHDDSLAQAYLSLISGHDG